eukprot:gene4803-6731_t
MFLSNVVSFVRISTYTKRIRALNYSIVADTLQNELKIWRKRTADELQLPLYQVATNKLINNIVETKPSNMYELAALSGMGPVKLNKFGRMILNIVSWYSNNNTQVGQNDVNLKANADEDRIFWEEFSKTIKPKKPKTKKNGEDELDTTVVKPRRKPAATVNENEDAFDLNIYDMIHISELNDEQQKAAKIAIDGNNVFITGSAGTGKTFLLRYVVQELIRKYGPEGVAVTAPTGIAAINVNGQTIHSFSGIGLGEGTPEFLINKVIKNKSSVTKWTNTKCLIIDEISMISKSLFELLDRIAKLIHNNDLPFGGIQLIVVGDFMQLPPVLKTVTNQPFPFQSPIWEAAGFNCISGMIHLEKIERQNDPEFIKYLNEIRIGNPSIECINKINSCLITNKPKPTNGIIPTKLYCVNKDVDQENRERLAELSGDLYTMYASDTWKVKPRVSTLATKYRNAMDSIIPDEIQLKIGAQVMLLRNRSKMTFGGQTISSVGLVNGSRGKIVAFSESVLDPDLLVPTVEFDNGYICTIGPVEFIFKSTKGDGYLIRSQIPLKLAWASTIHKSQGCTLSCAELMLDNSFAYGQAYVALSRVRSIDGLWMSKPLHASSIKTDPAVLKFYGYR